MSAIRGPGMLGSVGVANKRNSIIKCLLASSLFTFVYFGARFHMSISRGRALIMDAASWLAACSGPLCSRAQAGTRAGSWTLGARGSLLCAHARALSGSWTSLQSHMTEMIKISV